MGPVRCLNGLICWGQAFKVTLNPQTCKRLLKKNRGCLCQSFGGSGCSRQLDFHSTRHDGGHGFGCVRAEEEEVEDTQGSVASTSRYTILAVPYYNFGILYPKTHILSILLGGF